MKSIRTKISLLVIGCVLVSTVIVFGIGIMNIHSVLTKDNITILNQACQKKAQEIDEILRDIEQSVTMIYNFASDSERLNNMTFKDEAHCRKYVSSVEEVALDVGKNTEGSLTIYYRFTPGLTEYTEGFWYVRDGVMSDFHTEQVTDITLYEKDDVEHVGWYYIPMEKKRPIWMSPYYNKNLKTEMISYIIPLFYNKKPIGIIGMDIDLGMLRNKVASVVQSDSQNVFLVDEKGEIVFYYQEDLKGEKKKQFQNEVNKLLSAIEKNKSTNKMFTYSWEGQKYQMVSQKLENDMKMIMGIPLEEVWQPAKELFDRTLLSIIIALIVSFVLATQLARIMVRSLKELTTVAKQLALGNLDVTIRCKSKDEVGILAESFRHTSKCLKEDMKYINSLAYKDALTSVNNKTAYEEKVEELNQSIRSHTGKFAVVVMDINNLKMVNDILGHEKGDLLIQDAVRIMGEIFGKEQIYRIGGDEFTVILTGNMYYEAENFMMEFDKKLTEFNHSGKRQYTIELQVARGLSAYDRTTDKNYSDVFNRADALMYKNKRMQKAEQNQEVR